MRGGQNLFRQKKYGQATQLYDRRIVKQWPQYSPKILLSYERALVGEPNNLELKISLADLYLSEGNELEAIDEYEEVLEHDPANLTYYKELTALLFRRKKYDRVIEVLARPYKLGMCDEALVTILASCYLETNLLQKAIQVYEQLVQMTGEKEGHFRTLCDLYFQDRQFSMAAMLAMKRLSLNRDSLVDVSDFIERCLEKDPAKDWMSDTLIDLYMSADRPDRATKRMATYLEPDVFPGKQGFLEERIHQLLEDFPGFPEGLLLSGQFYKMTQRYSQAADAFWELARNQHFESKAVEELLSILTLFHDQLSVLQYLGEFYKAKGDTEKALFYMRRMLTVDVTKSIAVISQCKDLIDHDPQNYYAKLTMAEAYLKRENYSGAIEISRDLIKRGESELEASKVLLNALLATRDYVALREVLEHHRHDLLPQKEFHDHYAQIYPTELMLRKEVLANRAQTEKSLEARLSYCRQLIESVALDEALVELQVISRQLDHYQISYYLGLCFLEMGNYFSAAAYFKKALEKLSIETSPEYLLIMEQLARTYEILGDIDKGLESYRKVLEIDYLREDVKEREEALKNCPYLEVTGKSLIAVARDRDATDITLLFNRNVLRKKARETYDVSMGILKNNEAVEEIFRGKMNSATDLINMALLMDPAHHNILNNHGVLFLISGDYRQAMKIFEKILKTRPSFSAGALYNLAFCFTYGLARYDEAKKLLMKLAELDDQLKEAHLMAGDIAYFQGDVSLAREEWTRYRDSGLLPMIASRRLFDIDFVPSF